MSLERVARVFSLTGDHDSMERLFKLVVLSVAVGNLDLHAKNLSVLHPPDGSMMLAPAYDVVPQAHQSNDGEVALAVAGEYRHAAITLEHLVAEGRAWRLTDAATLSEETLAVVLELTGTATPHERAHAGLVEDIARFTSNLLARTRRWRRIPVLTNGSLSSAAFVGALSNLTLQHGRVLGQRDQDR